MKYFITVIVGICSILFSDGQNLNKLKLADIPIIANLDSLREALKKMPPDTKNYLYWSICYVDNLDEFHAYIPDDKVLEIDSLGKQIHLPLTDALTKYWTARKLIKYSINIYCAKLLLDSATNIFKVINDKHGLFLCLNEYKYLDIITMRMSNNLEFQPQKLRTSVSDSERLRTFNFSMENVAGTNYSVREKALALRYQLFEYSLKMLPDTNYKTQFLKSEGELQSLIKDHPELKMLNSDMNYFKGYYFLYLFKYDSALHYFTLFKNGLPDFDKYSLSKIYLNIAYCYLSEKLQNETKNEAFLLLAEQAFKNNREGTNSVLLNKYAKLKVTYAGEYISGIYENLALIQKNKNDFKKALNYSHINDSITQVTVHNTNLMSYITLIQERNFKYSQDKINEISNKNKNVKIAFWSSLVFIIVLGAFLFKLRKANKEIVKLQKTREEFYAMISHDLRSPLHGFEAIIDNIRFLIKKNRFEDLEKLSSTILMNTKNLSSLLNNLLFWSISKYSLRNNQKELIEAKFFFTELIAPYIAIAKMQQKTMELNIQETFSIFTYRNELNILCRNLLDNAVKYSEVSGIIEVFVSLKNNNLHFIISNPAKEVDLLKLKNFEKLFAAEKPMQPGENGMNLGLILIKQSINTLEGKLYVNYENNKVVFEITIPNLS